MEEEEKIQQAEQALKMRADGAAIANISESTGMRPQDVVDLIAGVGTEFTTIKGIKEEAALLSMKATRRDRLRLLVANRDRLQAEFEARDLSDIPTDRLAQMLLKLNEAIRAEVTPPCILSTPHGFEAAQNIATE